MSSCVLSGVTILSELLIIVLFAAFALHVDVLMGTAQRAICAVFVANAQVV